MYKLNLPILQTLHEEHMAVMALLERLENFLRKRKPDAVPSSGDAEAAALFSDLVSSMEGEIGSHYAFEEQYLFPRFTEMADAGIPMMLHGEHDIIRPVAARLADIARAAAAGPLSAGDWKEFHALGREMVEREVFHVQKEEMGFLPALDQMLPPASGPELERAYAALKAG
ncbi:MAG: hemerythrin domain-containing protein [Alphaproteobacteria bacterium]|nr:hemerythrin domain-containing protein [Alphaproteobacteria bacterium]